MFATLVALLIAVPVWAGPGQLRVEVVDDAELLPVDGVALQLSGETLIGGTRSQITGADGLSTFTELPPGIYRLVSSKAGFRSVTIEGISVTGNRTTVQAVRLTPAEVEEVVIVGRKSVVDTVSTAVGQVLTKEFLQRVPSGRTYQTAVQTVPGVTAGSGGNPNMGGSASNENTFAESYTHPGYGPQVLADVDRLSTFAIDVDTASYALCRAKLVDGVMPPEDAVRVEEFVNAFHYGWDPPAGNDPLGVQIEAARHPLENNKVLLSVALQGHAEEVADRPVRLTFLVDVSGSMSAPDKLPLVQHALHRLVDGLGLEDRVAIATYAGNTGIALNPSWTVDKRPIHRAIDGLSSGGSTAMGDGIVLAYGMAEEMYVEQAENRVVILTDGDANVGFSSPEQLLGLVNRWAGEGISLSVVGFGQGNYKDALLERMADKGDGNYHYVDDAREAERVFGRDLTSNLVTLARDVKVQVEFPEEAVFSWRQLGYENRAVADEDFRDDAVDGGEVGAGHQVTALYELVLRDHPTGDLARVRVRAEPAGREIGPAIEFGEALAVDEPRYDQASRDLRWAAAVATFAEVLRGSPYVAEVGWKQVLALVDGAIDRDDPDQAELRELVVRAAELSSRP